MAGYPIKQDKNLAIDVKGPELIREPSLQIDKKSTVVTNNIEIPPEPKGKNLGMKWDDALKTMVPDYGTGQRIKGSGITWDEMQKAKEKGGVIS